MNSQHSNQPLRQQPSRRRDPSLVREVLRSAFKRYGLDRELERYQFVAHWQEIVGPEIAKRTKPENIRGRNLIVEVADSVWAQELSFQKRVILNRLRKFIPSGMSVEDIHFRVTGHRQA